MVLNALIQHLEYIDLEGLNFLPFYELDNRMSRPGHLQNWCMPVVDPKLHCINPGTLTTYDWNRAASFAPHMSPDAIGAAQWSLLNTLGGEVVLEAEYSLQIHIEPIRAPGVDLIKWW